MTSPVPQQQVPTTDTAPVIPGAPVVKQTERPHPATPFVRGWLLFVAILLGWGRQLVPDGEEAQLDAGDLRWILPAIAGVVVLAAVIGFVSWYFTRFIIDDEELRIETGAIFKKSTKIPFERLQSVDIIQPLAARIFGLAELRLEAGAGDSTTKLRYLTRSKASRLRDYLLTRAHGQSASIRDLDQGAPASALTDLGSADRPLVRVLPQRLIVGFLLSSEWLLTLMVLVVVLVVTARFGVVKFALGALIPMAIGAVTMISRRVISMFNFTLAESPRGLRITRGLTNLTSQSVPINRIQGLKITQSMLWKPLGLYRVDTDIVGYGQSNSDDNDSSATSVLLPVATAEEAALAISRVLPGIDLDQVELHPSPRRARWLRWLDFWTLRYGWNDQVVITEHGWVSRVRDVVPHAKTQSVRIEQGPLQRRLGLADVHFDTPKGLVKAVAQELDVRTARELALSQLDRARAAREAARQQRPVDDLDDDAGEGAVLAAFGIGPDQLLGSGGESKVFALDHERVLRLYRARHEAPEQTAYQLRALYQTWQNADIGIEVPMIIEVGERGQPVLHHRPTAVGPQLLRVVAAGRRRRAAPGLDQLPRCDRAAPSDCRARCPVSPGWSGPAAPQQFDSLGALLHGMLAGPAQSSREQLERDLPSVAQVWERLHADLAKRQVVPTLVHGDVCAPNAYVSRGPSGPVVTGIGDFSPHTVNADPMMDITGAVAFLELEPYAEAAQDSAWLEAAAVERHGPDTAHWIDVYRRFYGFYFSNSHAFDPALYGWCLRQLGRVT